MTGASYQIRFLLGISNVFIAGWDSSTSGSPGIALFQHSAKSRSLKGKESLLLQRMLRASFYASITIPLTIYFQPLSWGQYQCSEDRSSSASEESPAARSPILATIKFNSMPCLVATAPTPKNSPQRGRARFRETDEDSPSDNASSATASSRHSLCSRDSGPISPVVLPRLRWDEYHVSTQYSCLDELPNTNNDE